MNTHYSKLAADPEEPSVVVEGVGPDCPVTETAGGGKQSDSPYMCEALPPLAMLAIARVRKHGVKKYGFSNHESVPPEKFLGHALGHLFAYMAGDQQEDHLAHALCDLALMVEVVERAKIKAKLDAAFNSRWEEVFSLKKELAEVVRDAKELEELIHKGSSPT